MVDERDFHGGLVTANFFTAVVVFVFLFYVSAPYGRHGREGWGKHVGQRIGWILMEAPSPILFAIYYLIGNVRKNGPLIVFLLLWEAHYLHRAFIYPMTIPSSNKTIPVSMTVMAFFFNLSNSYINGRYLFTFSNGYPDVWIKDWRFLVGFMLFLTGFVINRWADGVLRRLRHPGETGYRIPYGGLYQWISCPNYFGEIVEWIGWAVCTWSLPGSAFAVWTIANLAPRAYSHHRWYQTHFNYPKERKALVPAIW